MVGQAADCHAEEFARRSGYEVELRNGERARDARIGNEFRPEQTQIAKPEPKPGLETKTLAPAAGQSHINPGTLEERIERAVLLVARPRNIRPQGHVAHRQPPAEADFAVAIGLEAAIGPGDLNRHAQDGNADVDERQAEFAELQVAPYADVLLGDGHIAAGVQSHEPQHIGIVG
jgi:hypothetical protein